MTGDLQVPINPPKSPVVKEPIIAPPWVDRKKKLWQSEIKTIPQPPVMYETRNPLLKKGTSTVPTNLMTATTAKQDYLSNKQKYGQHPKGYNMIAHQPW